jgi:hypothetical protein
MLSSPLAKARYAKNRWCQRSTATMMRAMPKPRLNPAHDSAAEQGSSVAKLLADYAAMSPDDQPSSEMNRRLSQPPLFQGASVEKTSPVLGEAARSAGEGLAREIGGRDGPEPTRYGDWEKSGRCIDF